MPTVSKSKEDDDEIIKAFIKKDEKILVQWYDKMKPAFMNMCRRYMMGQEKGLDIYQDTMASLYLRVVEGKLSDIKSGSLEGYLMHIGRNKIVDIIRTNVKYEDPKLKDELIRKVNEYTELEFSESVVSSEQKDLSDGLKKLGSRCYEVIKLFYYEGLSIDEIQVYMKYKDKNTVKALKSRCMKQLRTQVVK